MPAMAYGSKLWTVDRKIEQMTCVPDMSLLKWVHGVTKEDKIRKKYISDNIVVASIVVKMRDNGLRWLKHVRGGSYRNNIFLFYIVFTLFIFYNFLLIYH